MGDKSLIENAGVISENWERRGLNMFPKHLHEPVSARIFGITSNIFILKISGEGVAS